MESPVLVALILSGADFHTELSYHGWGWDQGYSGSGSCHEDATVNEENSLATGGGDGLYRMTGYGFGVRVGAGGENPDFGRGEEKVVVSGDTAMDSGSGRGYRTFPLEQAHPQIVENHGERWLLQWT